jgi:uncharacterized protein
MDVANWALSEAHRIVGEVLARHDATGIRVFLFGSRARGDAHSFSDIDVAFDNGGQPLPACVAVDLAELFEASCIPYTVDLVDLAYADASLIAKVMKEGIAWIGS